MKLMFQIIFGPLPLNSLPYPYISMCWQRVRGESVLHQTEERGQTVQVQELADDYTVVKVQPP